MNLNLRVSLALSLETKQLQSPSKPNSQVLTVKHLHLPECGQGRNHLNRSSASRRVLAVPEMPPRWNTLPANNPLGTRTFIGPALSQSEAAPACTAAFTLHPRSAVHPPEAETRAPSSRALSRSRDLAYVTAARHLGLWLSHKLPGPRCALFLEACLAGGGFGACVPVPALRCWLSAWRGARVGSPALLLCPAPRWTAAGTGEAALGEHVACRSLACARGCWDGGGVPRPPAAVRQGGRRRRGRGRP